MADHSGLIRMCTRRREAHFRGAERVGDIEAAEVQDVDVETRRGYREADGGDDDC